jgi:hypothetical protein
MHDIQTGIFLKATVQMTEIKLSTDIFGSELNGKFGSITDSQCRIQLRLFFESV